MSFVASELVDWLVKEKETTTRELAVAIGEDMLEKEIIISLNDGTIVGSMDVSVDPLSSQSSLGHTLFPSFPFPSLISRHIVPRHVLSLPLPSGR